MRTHGSVLIHSEVRFRRSPLITGLAFWLVTGLIGLRAATEDFTPLRVSGEKNQARDAQLKEYLGRDWPCRVTQVAAGAEQIHIEGQVSGGRGDLFVAEVPMFAGPDQFREFSPLQSLTVGADGRFSVNIERREKIDSDVRDRLLSRWAVVRKIGERIELMSSARYADSVAAGNDLPEERPRSKKGLGGFSAGGPVNDLDELGIAAVTVNVVLNGFMRDTAGLGRTPFQYEGQTWFADDNAVSQLDRTLREASRRQVIVSAIILIAPARDNASAESFSRRVAHPEAAAAGIYVMPNLASREGVAAYAAALDFLAKRYSRPDRRFGRIHHWILHNEVNSGWVWTNAGEQTARSYMDLYHKSLRATYLIARQYDPRTKVFISLDHHWSERMNEHCYTGRELLDLLLDFTKAEGDFEWAIAHHPYPQDLFEPRVWKDTQATTNFDTPKITFKNLEVLVRWAEQPQTRFLGKSVRTIHLTEQGFNSRDYGEKSLQDQAAGMAYAWRKIQKLDAIEVFHYHNWMDNRGEGGLRIGLRKFPDEPADPLGRKPIWFLYQALGTSKEDQAMAFALPILGARDWSEVR